MIKRGVALGQPAKCSLAKQIGLLSALSEILIVFQLYVRDCVQDYCYFTITMPQNIPHAFNPFSFMHPSNTSSVTYIIFSLESSDRLNSSATTINIREITLLKKGRRRHCRKTIRRITFTIQFEIIIAVIATWLNRRYRLLQAWRVSIIGIPRVSLVLIQQKVNACIGRAIPCLQPSTRDPTIAFHTANNSFLSSLAPLRSASSVLLADTKSRVLLWIPHWLTYLI